MNQPMGGADVESELERMARAICGAVLVKPELVEICWEAFRPIAADTMIAVIEQLGFESKQPH